MRFWAIKLRGIGGVESNVKRRRKANEIVYVTFIILSIVLKS